MFVTFFSEPAPDPEWEHCTLCRAVVSGQRGVVGHISKIRKYGTISHLDVIDDHISVKKKIGENGSSTPMVRSTQFGD